jgi:hippurate hydrolase
MSVTQIHAGAAYNVVPEHAHIAGTVRYFREEVCDLAMQRMQAICDGIAAAYEVEISLDMRNVFDVLVNDHELSDAYIDAATDILGAENVSDISVPATGSEDFADMLRVVPGAYCRVGHTGTMGLHNPAFVLGEELLPIGASIMARLVEKRLPLA